MAWHGERPLRVAHLFHGWLQGGLEQLVVDLAELGQEEDVESLLIGLGPDGPLRDAAGDKGLATRWIESPGLTPATLGALRRALNEFDADVVHAHDLGPWLNAVAVRALRPFTPVVATFHQMGMPEGAKRLAARGAAAFTGALVACGSEVRAQMESWAPPTVELLTIGNGVRVPPLPTPEARVRARVRLELPLDALVIGNIGRLAEVKGPDLLLAAFLASFSNRPDVHLAFIGSGALEHELRARAKGHANVHLAGAMLEARELLPAFDLYAQTSLSEGRSLSMLEAMASGLPTIAHDLPGVREIHDEHTALLVRLRDSAGLSSALEALVADAPRRRALGEAARRASARFTLNATLDAYLDLYRALITGSSFEELEVRG